MVLMKKSDHTDVVGNTVIAKDSSNNITSASVTISPAVSSLINSAHINPSQRANQKTMETQ
jgi:hypothetical protein